MDNERETFDFEILSTESTMDDEYVTATIVCRTPRRPAVVEFDKKGIAVRVLGTLTEGQHEFAGVEG